MKRRVRLALVCSLLAPGLAAAHAVLTKSEPAPRAQLASAPAAVRLWFNEPLEAAFCAASVLDDAGHEVSGAPARVSAQERKLLELALPALPAGQYTVRYQVLSIDGHTVKGSFVFRLKDRAAPK